MAERKIMQGVQARGRLFRTNSSDGDKDTLNELLTPERAEALVEQGVLVGDWSGNKKAAEANPQRQTAPGPARPQGQVRRGTEQDHEVAEGGEPLPAGFPARAALVKGGYDTQEKVEGASDEELAALDGVGDATVKKIRDESK